MIMRMRRLLTFPQIPLPQRIIQPLILLSLEVSIPSALLDYGLGDMLALAGCVSRRATTTAAASAAAMAEVVTVAVTVAVAMTVAGG